MYCTSLTWFIMSLKPKPLMWYYFKWVSLPSRQLNIFGSYMLPKGARAMLPYFSSGEVSKVFGWGLAFYVDITKFLLLILDFQVPALDKPQDTKPPGSWQGSGSAALLHFFLIAASNSETKKRLEWVSMQPWDTKYLILALLSRKITKVLPYVLTDV